MSDDKQGKTMNIGRKCEIQTLAKSEIGSVDYCPDCGIFHVGFGMTSFRMRLAALHLFSATLASALERFKAVQGIGHPNVLSLAKPGGSSLH